MFVINKDLLPIKAHFLMYSGMEGMRKMIPLIYREKGVPNKAVGIAYSAMALVGLLITAVGGTVADYFKVHRMLLIILLLGATIGTSAIYFLPDIPNSAPKILNTDTTIPGELDFKNLLELDEQGLLESSENHSNSSLHHVTSKTNLVEILGSPEFIFLVICHATEQATLGLVFSLTDTLVFKTLDGETTKFGQQKMFGEIGLMIFAAVAGCLVDWYSEGLPQRDFLPAFSIFLVLMILDISILAKLKIPEIKAVERTDDKKSKSILDVFNFKSALFFVSMFVLGFAMNHMWVFKVLVAEDITKEYDNEFQYHKLLQGLMISMQCVGSTLFFGISGSLIRRFGHTIVFVLGFCFLGLHFTIYYFISNPWFILPLELLNGPSYCLIRATSASYAAKIAPPDALGRMQATSQFSFYLGYVIAGFAGGYVYNSFGGCLTFLLMGSFVFGFTIFYACCKGVSKIRLFKSKTYNLRPKNETS